MPILEGHKSLIVGIANDQSIAYGCAQAFRNAGANWSRFPSASRRFPVRIPDG